MTVKLLKKQKQDLKKKTNKRIKKEQEQLKNKKGEE